jgi:hypothetical protein
MAFSVEQTQSIDDIVAQMCAIAGVTHAVLGDGRIALDIVYDGERRTLLLSAAAGDYRTLKDQIGRICEALAGLGIREGMTFMAPAAPRRARRPLSPEMLAATARKKQQFEAWQALWRKLREAERSLDIAFEFNQMRDYY